jgi:hypothetical protein
VASPKFGPWWVLWIQSCMWLVLAPKVLWICTNHFVLVLCKSVKVNEVCQFFLVPSRSSNTPLYPSKVLRARERAPSSSPFRCLYTLNSSWVYQGAWERVILELGIKNLHNQAWIPSTIITNAKNLLQLGTKKLRNQSKTKQATNSSNSHHRCQKPLITWNKKTL